MRKNYMKCFLLAALIGMTGCNDFLDVESKSQFSEDIVFSKEETAAGMVNGIYHYFGETNSYRSRLISYVGVNSDSELQSAAADGSESTQDRRSMAVYLQNANLADGFNNAGGKEPWSYLYAAIEHCNLCIAGIREYGNPAPGNRMGELLGEALTLRAFFYFDLVKYWGDVPARFTPLSKDDLFIPKSDRTVIYDQIIGDLGYASELLPWAGGSATTTSVERVSKGFAKGLRARIALNAAGKALVRQDRNNTAGGDAGKIDYVFEDAAKRQQLYDIVKNECIDVIGSGKHPLSASFSQIWKEVMNDDASAGRESMFEIGFKTARGQHGRLLGMVSSVTKYTEKEVSPYVIAMPTLFYDYAEGDSRRDVTLVPYKYVKTSQKLTGGDEKNGFQDISDITKISFGKYRTSYRDYEKNGPMKGDDWGTNFPVMRSADLYLMAAEAINELEGPANAKPYLVEVRNRAFGSQDGNLNQYAAY
ncbi:MAG: RagB/SusD family nutrient uptake outer membrane protein, partial [Bacteroidales bacterium]